MGRETGALITCLVAAAVAVVGCGGDDDGLPTGEVSKSEYILQADRICARGDRQINLAADQYFGEELGLRSNQRPTDQQIARFGEDEVIPGIQDQHDELVELEAPEEDAEELEEIYDTLQAEIDAAEEDPVTVAEDAFAEASRLARDYGLEACGS
jgi:hypothetical protein